VPDASARENIGIFTVIAAPSLSAYLNALTNRLTGAKVLLTGSGGKNDIICFNRILFAVLQETLSIGQTVLFRFK